MNDLEQEKWDFGLKSKEKLFCLYYCTNDRTFLNATASYRETYRKKLASGRYEYPAQSTCETNGSKLCRKERVKNAIRKLLSLTQTELDEQNVYRVVKDLCLLSFYNPAEILKADGTLRVRKLEDLGDLAKCIAQITPTKAGIKYTLYDRNKAIHELLNYLNIIRPEAEIDVNLPVIETVYKAVSAKEWNDSQEED